MNARGHADKGGGLNKYVNGVTKRSSKFEGVSHGLREEWLKLNEGGSPLFIITRYGGVIATCENGWYSNSSTTISVARRTWGDYNMRKLISCPGITDVECPH